MSTDAFKCTPTGERCVTSYPARRGYRPGVVFPPAVPHVAGTIDIHAHAHEGQQDALALAQLASQSGMRGILYKTIGPMSAPYRPAAVIREVAADLARWSEDAGVMPVHVWAGYVISMDLQAPNVEAVREAIADGIAGVWLPVFNHANTLSKVGGKLTWWDRTADPAAHSEPLPWDEALRYGHYGLDEHGKLKPAWSEIVRACAESGVALFFGHATHREIWAITDLLDELGAKIGVIDHPFSPFVDLDVDEMRELAGRSITLNFTYDELSPLLGVDPAKMYAAIRAVGPQYCTLSSDAGEPLFPHSVECMRLIRGFMEAFGMTPEELRLLTEVNPARIVRLPSAPPA